MSVAVAAIAASLLVAAGAAPAAAVVLYFEDFEDQTLAPNTTINEGEVTGGVGSFNDDMTTNKSVFNVVQSFAAPVMTFSFDVVAPVVPTGGINPTTNRIESELLFRAGRGTGTSSIGSADDIVELILHRDNVNRGGYLNNGNESVFVVVNNSAGPLNVTSPVDGSNVPLNNQQFVAFIRNNNAVDAYVQARGPENWLLAEPITRFFIGSGSDIDQDTFSIDNVLVVDEVSFGAVVPMCDPGDVNCDDVVDLENDFEAIRMNFRDTGASRSEGDLTGDGLVSLPDFVQWKTAFLSGGGSLEGVSFDFLNVPEPSSGAITMIAILSLLGCCRSRPLR